MTLRWLCHPFYFAIRCHFVLCTLYLFGRGSAVYERFASLAYSVCFSIIRYQTSPDLRLAWLQNMAAQHTKVEHATFLKPSYLSFLAHK